MSTRQSILRGLLVAMAGLAACLAPSLTPEAMVEKTAEPMAEIMMEKTPEATAEAMMPATPKTEGDAMMSPAWLQTPLTSAGTRASFVLTN